MKISTKLFNSMVILFFSFLLSACANKNQVPEKNLPDNTPDNRAESSTANSALPESESHSVENEPILNNSSIAIEDMSLSLSESKQDIIEKLETSGLDYSEVQPDYPDEVEYDSYYNVAGGCIQIYFLNDSCVRIRLTDLQSASSWKIQTTKELRPGDTYTQMIELYGDDFETHTYSYKGIYTVYRYSIEDFIYEVGIPGEDSEEIYNIDIYLPSQSPIYKYGEEISDIENEPIVNNSSITIGDMSLSLSESKLPILRTLVK